VVWTFVLARMYQERPEGILVDIREARGEMGIEMSTTRGAVR
jgi:hypothetical protein